MHRVKHGWIFHADSREMIDVEEAAVVDLVHGGAPVGKPVDLFFQ